MQVRQLLAASVGIIALSTSVIYADQPEMNEALKHLQIAKDALEKAVPDKGGHREQAIALIERAMRQVQEGKRFALDHKHDMDQH